MEAKEISIGLELEANVIDKLSGKACLDYNNQQFKQFSHQLLSQGHPEPHTEFDAATVELITLAYNHLDLAFNGLTKNLRSANQLLEQQGYLLLLLGLHPGRERDELIITRSPYCKASLPLMAEYGGPLFYCSYQINIGVAYEDIQYVMALCQWLQFYMWPCSAITQSSPIFAEKNTNYKSFRVRLNDALSGSRAGPLPQDLKNIEAFNHYCAQLPDEEISKRLYSVWYDIFPKLIDNTDPSKGYRIEIRLADTTELPKLYVFTQAMVLTFVAILNLLKAEQAPILPSSCWLQLNRDAILKKGNQARMTQTGEQFYSLEEYLNIIWRPLVDNYASQFNINLDNLIRSLTAESRADLMLGQLEHLSTNQMALDFALSDYEAMKIAS